jgi:hypothetical protein
MKNCQWCSTPFSTKISYQIYCSSACREESTKEKIAERYAITRRSRKIGKLRLCKACQSRLSAYNDDVLCEKCLVNPADVSRALREIKGIVKGKDE